MNSTTAIAHECTGRYVPDPCDCGGKTVVKWREELFYVQCEKCGRKSARFLDDSTAVLIWNAYYCE